jgi:hypothetical protein
VGARYCRAIQLVASAAHLTDSRGLARLHKHGTLIQTTNYATAEKIDIRKLGVSVFDRAAVDNAIIPLCAQP